MNALFALFYRWSNSSPKRLFASLLLGWVCCAPVHAIPVETVYPGAQPGQNGNPNSTNPVVWTCSSEPATDIGTLHFNAAQKGDDCISQKYRLTSTYAPEPIGFEFQFYKKNSTEFYTYTNFYIYTNGFITLGDIPQTPDVYFLSPNEPIYTPTPSSIPSPIGAYYRKALSNFIAPFWDDVAFNTENDTKPITIYYKVENTLPSVGNPSKKQLIVQWTNAEIFTGKDIHPPLGTFQAILYENTNGANPTCDIRLQYRQLVGTKDRVFGSNASIGTENIDGSAGYKFFSFHSGSGTNPSHPFPLLGITLKQDKAICLKWNGTNNYTMSTAPYDPVYLTPPPSPPPAIPEIIVPSLECPLTNQTFMWQPGKYQNVTATGPITYTLMITLNEDFTLSFDATGNAVTSPPPGFFPKSYTTTGTSYTITDLTLEDTKDYYVAVIAENDQGKTWSDIKKCTATSANTSPWISSLTDIKVDAGTTISGSNFTIGDSETPPTCDTDITVVDDATNSLPTGLLTTSVTGGTTQDCALAISPVNTSSTGKMTIKLTVNDKATPAKTASTTFNVTIRPTLSVANQSVVSGNSLNYTVTAQGSNLSYSFTGSLPTGATSAITAGGIVFSGIPTATGTFPITVTVTDTATNESVTKSFDIKVTSPPPPPPPPVVYYGLTIQHAGTGTGTVTGTDGIDCSNISGTSTGVCYRSFSENSGVSLATLADSDSEFVSWSTGCSASFSITGSMTCTATFNLKPFAVTITKPTNGKVSAPGLDCGTDCSENVAPNGTITLTAEADPGFVFSGWAGDCAAETANPLTLTVDKAKSCEAIFKPLFKLTVSALNGTINTVGDTTIDCGSVCAKDYVVDTLVKLQATPQTGYVFTGWTGSCDGTANPLSVTMNAAKTCQAVFTAEIKYLLNISVDKYGQVAGAGVTCSTLFFCNGTYSPDSMVTLTATPETDYIFTGWDGDCSGTDNSITVTMDKLKNCQAHFILKTTPILVIANPTQGKVTGLNIDCGTICSATYPAATPVILTATPEPGYTFTGWSGDCSGTDNPLTIDVNSAKNCTANFTAVPLTLTLTPPTHGKISTPNLDCGTTCTQTLAPDSKIPLTATPEPGYIFTGWSGDCAGTENPLTVTMDKAKNCTANFAPITLPILVVTNPTQGTVTGSGIDCGTTCTAAYPDKTTATLTATPAPGYTFTGWSGDCSGTANPLTLDVNSGKTCTANFTPILVPLNVTKPANGSVSIPGLDCSNGCNTNLPQNSPVTITAIPDPGFVFTGWSGDCAGTTNPLTLMMNAAKNCTPIFAPADKPMIIIANPTQGKVTGDGIDCGTNCTKTFTAPTTITLTATPEPGFVFTGWSGDCSGTANPLTIEVSKAKSCKANFTPVLLPVTLPKPANGKVNAQGLNCDTTSCNGQYPQNSNVTLTAIPDPGFVFSGWSGDCSGMENPLTIQIDKAKNCQANFIPVTQPALIISEPIKGTVTGDQIEPCTTACVRTFPQKQTITLTATPQPGYVFTGWTGDCSGTANPITVEIDKATTCIPSFTPAPLVVKISKPLSGKVTGLGLNCGDDCTENYPYGSNITLTATPDEGFIFTGWSGSCSGTANPITVQAELAAQCVPLFAKYVPTSSTPVYALMVGNTDTSQGMVASQPQGIDCGQDCYEGFPTPTTVQLTATPNSGFRFQAWTGDCQGNANPFTLTVDATKNCQAHFEPLPVEPLPLQPSVLDIILKEGETQQHKITGGQNPRTVTQLPDSTLVDMLWDSPVDLLTVTGKVVGKTQLIITDAQQHTVIVNITVVPGCRYNMIGLTNKGEVLDGGFNCITPQVTDLTPACRINAVGINSEGKQIFSHSCFSNHVKTRAARPFVPDAYPMTQVLDFSATITVDPRFIGMKADVLMVAYSAVYGRVDAFMRDGDTWVDWDNSPKTLKPAYVIDQLPSQFDVPIYNGNLSDLLGDAEVYVGYRLENGDIYYNGVEPIRFQIGNSASVDPALDTEKNVNSNEVNAGSYFEPITATPDGLQNNHQIFTNREALSLVTYLLVDKKNVGQPADLLMVAVYQPYANPATSYQRIGENWVLWDEKIASLQPAQHYDQLPDNLEIPIYMGSLAEVPGEFTVYVGYRLSDNTIIFNGLSPHHFAVANALGRDKEGNPTQPTARFVNSVNYLNMIHSSGRVTAQDDIGVYSSIWVDPKHVGQKADILMVMLRGTDDHYASYQRNLDQWERWDEQQVSLKATIPNVTLEPLMKDLQLFAGQLEPDDYLMYLGYRLPDGEVVYNGGEIIHVKVDE